VILVDASTTHPHGFSPFGLAAQEAVVVLSGNSASITEAYSLIKKVSHAFSRKHFRILVEQGAESSRRSLDLRKYRPVAAQRGIARLDYAGAIPLDEALRQAAQLCRPVLVQAPESPSSVAFRDIASDMLYWQRSGEPAGSSIHAATVTLEPTHNPERTSSLMYTAAGQPTREQLVQRFMPLVKRIAYHLMARLPPSVQFDDLVQNGMLGLLDAIDRYQEGFGAQFETYATRMRGAMLDGLRENDWLPRNLRRECAVSRRPSVSWSMLTAGRRQSGNWPRRSA
jgi:hypothetical protein